MIKPGLLRTALEAALPEFLTDRDRLSIFVDRGRMVSRRTPGLAFEYRYGVRLFFEAFTGPPDAIMVPLLLWVRTHQPDLMLRFEREDQAITFAADILDQSSWDILISFELTEAVTLVARGDGSGWDVTHLPEPSPDDPSITGVEPPPPLSNIWLGDRLLLPGPPLPISG